MVVLAGSFMAPVHASDLSVSVQGQQVQAKFNLFLHQNMTALPSETTTLDSASNANLTSAFASALHTAYPSAGLSGLTVRIDSTKDDLNLTGTMGVSGVSNRTGDIVTANMTWLPFNVASDLTAGNLSFNEVGRRYFRPVVVDYANASSEVGRPNATITGVSFLVNQSAVGSPTAENYVGNFTMLDFRSLSPSLDQWNRNYTLSNDTTAWHYPSSIRLDFDMKIQRKNVTTHYLATFSYSARITVPGVARSQGSAILLDVGTGQKEWIMAAIVVIALVSAVAVQFLLRSRKKKVAKFQRR
jgi:hypothetical protein